METWTERKLLEIDREINRMYRQALPKIRKEWDEFFKSIEPKISPYYQEMINADDGEKLEKKRKYKNALKKFIYNSDEFKELVEKTAKKFSDVNRKAADAVNGNAASVYTHFFNKEGKEISKEIKDYPFTEAEESEVKGVYKNTINKNKDVRWNKKNILSNVLIGILVAQKVGDISDRISIVNERNRKSSLKNSLAVYGSNESLGKYTSLERADYYGVNVQKEWIATLDNRTRDTHVRYDGMVIGLDEEFASHLKYPQDPDAKANCPWEYYNCRCTLGKVVMGYKSDQRAARKGEVKGSYKQDSSFAGTKTITIPNMTYTEWYKKCRSK